MIWIVKNIEIDKQNNKIRINLKSETSKNSKNQENSENPKERTKEFNYVQLQDLEKIQICEIKSNNKNDNSTSKNYLTIIKEDKKVIFEVGENEKKRRIKNILEAIKNGLFSQSSGESNTIVPLFIIVSAVKIPSPIFHPYILLEQDPNQNNSYIVKGISNCINNSWIVQNIYIMETQKIKLNPEEKELIKNKIQENWDEFLKEIGLEENNNPNFH